MDFIDSYNRTLEEIDSLLKMLAIFAIDRRNYVYNKDLVCKVIDKLESDVDRVNRIIVDHPILKTSTWDSTNEKLTTTIKQSKMFVVTGGSMIW
ncbi:MAG: hypothetical protein NC131_12635 [Roseburia sp.]|nr:hypothetical protein [Roseburia sp.]